MIDGKKLEMSQKLAIYELMNAKLKQANIDLEQQLVRQEDYYTGDRKRIAELEQQLADVGSINLSLMEKLAELREENARLCGYDSYQEQQEYEK